MLNFLYRSRGWPWVLGAAFVLGVIMGLLFMPPRKIEIPPMDGLIPISRVRHNWN